jgi:hypothetical protein
MVVHPTQTVVSASTTGHIACSIVSEQPECPVLLAVSLDRIVGKPGSCWLLDLAKWPLYSVLLVFFTWQPPLKCFEEATLRVTKAL